MVPHPAALQLAAPGCQLPTVWLELPLLAALLGRKRPLGGVTALAAFAALDGAAGRWDALRTDEQSPRHSAPREGLRCHCEGLWGRREGLWCSRDRVPAPELPHSRPPRPSGSTTTTRPSTASSCLIRQPRSACPRVRACSSACPAEAAAAAVPTTLTGATRRDRTRRSRVTRCAAASSCSSLALRAAWPRTGCTRCRSAARCDPRGLTMHTTTVHYAPALARARARAHAHAHTCARARARMRTRTRTRARTRRWASGCHVPRCPRRSSPSKASRASPCSALPAGCLPCTSCCAVCSPPRPTSARCALLCCLVGVEG